MFGQILLAGGYRVGFHHGIVLVIEIEQVGRYPDTHRITFAAVTVDFYVHVNLLALRARAVCPCAG
ncbi:hypothetical protein TS71_02200 [Mycolicibacterium neoaurum]|uniref:Uncharacterized protein n=1 Tax=Mycolicibacterium neoaurum VKM Ac-1815D TaxID=700508 RepID=V5XJ44_MYCNE|nr:hypothetical protein D174_24075 [Mycolicibacterium neoaurum VKM Ac-1815D]AMO07650.1 hypothetical protein MyAD_23615 [Mycolicibacterium neoaurum]KJQ51603.1 hypothetical protein TS71_02200 [Mycolicibacterium neoaurum]KUM08819.1 hypothetical protein AVZ31_08610 [Mycolicibacterium neoaurum]